MPGFILHLTAAKILLNKYKISVDENAFNVGNLLPDVVKDKTESHFRDMQYKNKMVQYPSLPLFLEKYASYLNDSSVLGYYYHLYIDYKFITEFYPKTLKYLNENMQTETEKENVKWAYICKTGKIVSVEDFLSEEYYYGDFTRMNTWLIEKYQLSYPANTQIDNPGIEEVDYQDIENVLNQLKSYEKVPVDAIEHLQVFDLGELLMFLENAAQEWYMLNFKDVEE